MIINEEGNGLYSLLFKRLNEVKGESEEDIIPFPKIFEKLCRNFSMKKQECWNVLIILKNMEVIEIITQHGIRLKKPLQPDLSL